MTGSTINDRKNSTRDPSNTSSEQTEQVPPRTALRSSSPAKRPASDMEETGKDHMDIDQPVTGDNRQGTGQDSPRPTKPLPARSSAGEQSSLRAVSVDMLDDRGSSNTNGLSGASSDTTSVSNQESAATSVSATSCSPASDPYSASTLPSVDEQVGEVMPLWNVPAVEGQAGYLVSNKWLERVFARTSENLKKPGDFDKSATEGEIGPVDNSDLIDRSLLGKDLTDERGDEFIPVKPESALSQDFEILPEEAWNLIISWYHLKEGSPIIRRFAHNTAPQGAEENIVYELRPPIFTIRKLRNDAAGLTTQTLQENQRKAPRMVASRSKLYQAFLRQAKQAVGIDMSTKVQVWRVLSIGATEEPQAASGMLTPESSPRAASPAPTTVRPEGHPLLIDVAGFTSLADGTQREMVTGKDETANEKYNGHLNLQTAGLAEDQVLILEEQVGGPAGGEYISDTTAQSTIKNGVLLGNSKTGAKLQNKGLQSNTNSGRNSPTTSGPVTRGRTRRDGRTRGTVGLTNLGNTCYMNSALQCIRSVEELTLYFLQQKYKEDLNPNNPLGHGGTIAKAYAGLLGAIYDEGGVSAFSPKNFKFALGRAQPLFSGYGQQDSQEFLSFLVDGLHEDLNRILKKPYVENPESDDNTVHDPAAIKALGEKFREIHHARNDSVATDLFNGFYKNTMVCPECDKVSITFDPFSLVTLQLPIEQTWQHTVTFAPLHGRPIRIDVDIDKNGTIRSLKEYIAKRISGLQWNRLMGAEIYSHKFYRTLEDSKTIAESSIQQRDDIAFFELDGVPTNFPPPKKKQKVKSSYYSSWNNASSDDDIPDSESPLADRMVVPLFHRAQHQSSYSTSMTLKSWPSFILVTREEAKDYDSILKKVLARVATMTTRPFLTELCDYDGALDQLRTGSDTVLTTEEDASSNADPRIQDGSVEGEENMVEVTMTEGAETQTDESMDGASDKGSPKLPEVLRPGSFIAPEFRRLFVMKYVRSGKEMVPTGWSSIDQNKNYPTIQSRVRTLPSRRSSLESIEEKSSQSSDEEPDDPIQFSANAEESFDLANQSSEEEVPSIEPNFNRTGRHKNSRKNKGKKNKKMKTYSKKGKSRIPDQPMTSFTEPENSEDPALIRLGEGIILDWESSAFEALFEGLNEDDDRSMDTFKIIETLDDPELQEKKAKRVARKKNGISLDECFAETSKSEILSEENAWYCNRCKELRRASKTLEIWTAPDILVIHLKRFSQSRTLRDKIDVLVDFPTEGLDLNGRVGLPEGKDLVYDLFAVDNHYGGLGGGHYTAYAQNFYDKRWYEYNDSSVSVRNNPRSVVTSSAYLLFYRRRSSTPLGPPYLQKIVEAAFNPDSEENADASQPDSRNPSRSPGAGNGSRLGDSSRNGSSSASIGVGAALLRGGGSLSGGTAAGSLVSRGAGAGVESPEDDAIEIHSDEEQLPGYSQDEGYADDDGEGMNFNNINHINIEDIYAPLHQHQYHNPVWDFSNVAQASHQEDDGTFADANSNAPDMGSSTGAEELQTRMLEDFGDDDVGTRPGQTTPLIEDDDMPELVGDSVRSVEMDGDVAEVRLGPEQESSYGKLD